MEPPPEYSSNPIISYVVLVSPYELETFSPSKLEAIVATYVEI
jgi:hypothetical protein